MMWPKGRPSIWIGAITVLVLALGIGAAAWHWRARRAGPPVEAPAPTLDEPVVERVLARIDDPDSVAIKTRWMEEVRDVDVSMLDAPKLALFVRHANAQRCTCGCGYTLAVCRTDDPTCPVSGPRLATLRDSIRAGRIRDARGLRARPSAG